MDKHAEQEIVILPERMSLPLNFMEVDRVLSFYFLVSYTYIFL